MRAKLSLAILVLVGRSSNLLTLTTLDYKAFNQEERVELVNEIYEVLNQAESTNDWEEVAAVIHEWRESAIAISSNELAEAFT